MVVTVENSNLFFLFFNVLGHITKYCQLCTPLEEETFLGHEIPEFGRCYPSNDWFLWGWGLAQLSLQCLVRVTVGEVSSKWVRWANGFGELFWFPACHAKMIQFRFVTACSFTWFIYDFQRRPNFFIYLQNTLLFCLTNPLTDPLAYLPFFFSLLSLFLFLSFFFLFPPFLPTSFLFCAGDQTQGLTHARQTLQLSSTWCLLSSGSQFFFLS